MVPIIHESKGALECFPEVNLIHIHPEILPVRVLIVDAMAILQVMKKVSGMTRIAHLKKDFLNKILRLSRGYGEVRIVFYHYPHICDRLLYLCVLCILL